MRTLVPMSARHPAMLRPVKLVALTVVDVDLVDADVALADGREVRVRFDVSPQDDGALAGWEPDVFHDEAMPPGAVGKFIDAVMRFNAVAHALDAS